MNDLTKEELQIIIKGMSQYYLEEYSLRLMNKIQSMIDNYQEDSCKHEWHRFRSSASGTPPWRHVWHECIRCNLTTEPEVLNE